MKMWKQQQLKIGIIGLILSFGNTLFARTGEKPLYLSYEQRLVFSYLLAGSGASEEKQLEIADRFEKEVRRYFSEEPKEVQVKSFQEFLKLYRGEWPNSYSLESDLTLIEASPARGPLLFKGATPALQKQIDGFTLAQNEELYERAKSQLSLRPLLEFESKKDLLVDNSLRSLFKKQDKRDWILKGFSAVSSIVQEQIRAIQETGASVAKVGEGSGQQSGQHEAMKAFIMSALKEYFGRLSLDSKKQILSQFIGANLNAGPVEKFELMILASGPQFQKLLQVVARESGINPELLKIFKKLESKAKPIPAPLVRELFEAERDRYRWVSYEAQPLGTGTMAQVHKGVVSTPRGDQEVVIRFLKPEISLRVAEDHRILVEMAPMIDANPIIKAEGFPKVLPLVEDLNRTVTDELSLQDTIARQQKGQEVYSREVTFKGVNYRNVMEIKVPEVISPDPESKLHVQELVPGEKLDKLMEVYGDVIPDLKKVIMEEISKVWAREVLFGSGFFHSDLHQGNFLVDFTEPKLRISILDFGMGGTISREVQANILVLGAGIELLRSDVITEALWKISDKQRNELSNQQLGEKVAARVQEIRAGKLEFQSLDRWSAWAIDEGIRFPYEFVSLNRGMVILDKSLQDAGSKESLSSIAKIMAPRHVRSILSDLRAGGLLSFADLVKLGWVVGTEANESKVYRPVFGVRCEKVYR
ncbi:MAG: AarF/UbiB family protein [Proteobacteria bacterium]|nr:AarF/UbiB family protein [Pseudomonadota bacterium]